MFKNREWIKLALFLGLVHAIAGEDDSSETSKVVERRNDFFAARGRRSDGGGGDGPNDYFWANRGKKNSLEPHVVSLRDKVFNAPRPNGFLFPTSRFGVGKRSQTFNIPRPNGFFFPSVKAGKRNFNNPKPNGFFFPSVGKRSDKTQGTRQTRFNMPMPNGFFFPSTGKRSEMAQAPIWNMAKPNGFFFPSIQKPKRAYEDEEAEIEDMIDHILENPEMLYDDTDSEMVKRDNVGQDTFFAGRGKRESAHEDDSVALEGFFAGRGKKEAPSDIFFAGRG